MLSRPLNSSAYAGQQARLQPNQRAFQNQGSLQSDPYANLKRTNPAGFYGPSLMRQYGGNTQVLDQRFQALKHDQPLTPQGAPGTNIPPGMTYNPQAPNAPPGGAARGWSYAPGGGQQTPSGQWDPAQLWQMLSQMFGRQPLGMGA